MIHYPDENFRSIPDFGNLQQQSLKVGVVGLALCFVGAFFNSEQFFRSYLLAYVFWMGITLGCFAIMMLHHMSGGAWGIVIRRLLESGSRMLPMMALFFVPLVFGLHDLYSWARPEEVARDEVLQHKRVYLNIPFFLVRTVIYFVVWISVSRFLNKWSLEQDRTGSPPPRKFQLLSGPGLVLYGLTITFASIDWVMSLEPHWFSTIFGISFMGGQALSALAFVIVVLTLLSGRKPLSDVVSSTHFHDLGKLLLAFIMLWAYFAFSQYLIIWSGNLREETPWYLSRIQGGWGWIGVLLILFHFVLPFLLLLSRDLKRNARMLIKVAVVIIFMRLVDLFWIIVPASSHGGADVTHASLPIYWIWMYLMAPVGLGGVWLAGFLWQLKGRPLLPLKDPYLQQAIEHGQESL